MSGDQPQLPQPKRGRRSLAAGTIIVAAMLWGLAVALPVWETLSENGRWSVVQGVIPAMIGWLGILVLCPAWFANLLLIPLCFTLFMGRRGGFWLSVVAFAIAASAYTTPALYGDNETADIVVRRVGFYLWLGSFLVMALGHTLQVSWTDRSLPVACWATLVLMAMAVVGLEYMVPVGVSRLEATLKNPDDVTAFANVLARRPSQADKDRTLHWVVLQELDGNWSGTTFPRIEQLIAAGANINQADRYGTTSLMRAVSRGAESMVGLLIRAGADVNARDWRDRTALDIAREEWRSGPPAKRIQQILLNAGAQARGKAGRGVANTQPARGASVTP